MLLFSLHSRIPVGSIVVVTHWAQGASLTGKFSLDWGFQAKFMQSYILAFSYNYNMYLSKNIWYLGCINFGSLWCCRRGTSLIRPATVSR